MFNNESPRQRLFKNSLSNNVNDTTNGISKSFTSPKITSTPVHPPNHLKRDTIFATPPKPNLLSPRKYSLSEIATPPRRNNYARSNSFNNSFGPLLASTRYNVNVSTYMDIKSPGLAGRIVKYNEEQQKKSMPTHQRKYNSPGLFPIVHLFKKSPPKLEQKPKVTVRIASPDYSRHNSAEHNRMLMEGIVKPSTNLSWSSPKSNIALGTRSVLDALKEISRKRIHANEDYDLNEDTGKRQRTDCFNNTDTNKRYRDDSPRLDSPTSPSTSQKSKRVCIYDEYAASCSSSNFSFVNKPSNLSKRKSISTNTLSESPKSTKTIKLMNAETQTQESAVTKKLEQTNLEESTSSERDDQEKKVSPVKIFDDAPLERIRKNRLAILLGTLTGKETQLIPKPSMESRLNDDEKPVSEQNIPSGDKPLIGILSSSNKLSPRVNKHVTFSLSESNTTPKIVNVASNSNQELNVKITEPSSSSATHILSTTISDNQKGSVFSNMNSTTTSSLFSVSQSPEKRQSSFVTNSVSSTNTTTSLINPVSSSSEDSTQKSNYAAFSHFNNSSVSQPSTDTSASSPSKMGGFKFDLTYPAVTVNSVETTTSTPSFSFATPTASSTACAIITSDKISTTSDNTFKSGFNFSSTVATTSSAFIITTASPLFGKATTTTTSAASTSLQNPTSSPFKFNSFNTSTPSTNTSAFPSFSPKSLSNFATNSVTTTNNIPSFGLPTSTLSTTNPINTLSFGPNTSSLNTTTSSFGTTMSYPFGTSVTVPSFSVNSGSTATTTLNSNATVPSFGSITSPTVPLNLNSGTVSTTPPNFGSNNSFTSPSFSFNSSSAPITNTTTTNSNTLFGEPKTNLPSFGVSTSTSSAFTVTSSSSFGVQSPGFGTTTTTSSFTSPSTFGVRGTASSFVNPSAPTFGNPTPSFGISTGTSSFATTTTTTTSFAMQNPSFGTSTAPSFGTSTAPSFGISTAPSFGTSTTIPSFGTSTTIPSFGTSTTPSFGTSTTPSFGTSTTIPSFGTTSAPIFGVAATANNTFDGKSSSFGTGNNSNVFGTPTTQNSTFANNAKSLFGTVSNTASPFIAPTPPTTTLASSSTNAFTVKPLANTSFGNFNVPATTAGNAFGSSTTLSFGTTTTSYGSTTPAFGNTTPSFGSTTFGGTNANNGFGAGSSAFNTATTTASSGFGSTNTASPSFGVSKGGGFSFGNNNVAPVYGGNNNTNLFNAASPPSSNFNTGYASNSGNSAFSKAPTTTFGTPSTNTFGTTSANNSFSSTSSSGFGTENTAQSSGFNFGANAAAKPTTGVFTFGNNDPSKPSFNFSGSTPNNPPAFGGGNQAFNASGTPAFGASTAPSFGAHGPAMFNIGTGSTSTSQRARVKGKRRT